MTEEPKTEAAQEWAESQSVIFTGLVLASLAIHFLLARILGVPELISLAIVISFTLLVLFVIAPAIYWRAVARRMRATGVTLGYKAQRLRFGVWLACGVLTGVMCAGFVLTSVYFALTEVLYPGAILSLLSPILAVVSNFSLQAASNAYNASRTARELETRESEAS